MSTQILLKTARQGSTSSIVSLASKACTSGSIFQKLVPILTHHLRQTLPGENITITDLRDAFDLPCVCFESLDKISNSELLSRATVQIIMNPSHWEPIEAWMTYVTFNFNRNTVSAAPAEEQYLYLSRLLRSISHLCYRLFKPLDFQALLSEHLTTVSFLTHVWSEVGGDELSRNCVGALQRIFSSPPIVTSRFNTVASVDRLEEFMALFDPPGVEGAACALPNKLLGDIMSICQKRQIDIIFLMDTLVLFLLLSFTTDTVPKHFASHGAVPVLVFAIGRLSLPSQHRDPGWKICSIAAIELLLKYYTDTTARVSNALECGLLRFLARTPELSKERCVMNDPRNDVMYKNAGPYGDLLDKLGHYFVFHSVLRRVLKEVNKIGHERESDLIRKVEAWSRFFFGAEDRRLAKTQYEADKPKFCANPSCSISTNREDGTLHRCGTCGRSYYCSRSCQKLHWSDHKRSCKPIPVGRDVGPRDNRDQDFLQYQFSAIVKALDTEARQSIAKVKAPLDPSENHLTVTQFCFHEYPATVHTGLAELYDKDESRERHNRIMSEAKKLTGDQYIAELCIPMENGNSLIMAV